MISSIIIAVVVLGILLLVGIAIIFAILNIVTIQEVQGEEDIPAWQKAQESTTTPQFKCLKFNDGRLAIIANSCDNGPDISWFLSKGYHIDAATSNTDVDSGYVFMTR